MSYCPDLGQTVTTGWEEEQVFNWENCYLQQNKAYVHRKDGREWTLSVLF